MAPVTRSQIRSITAALKLRPTEQPPTPSAIPPVPKTKKRKPRKNKPKPKPKSQPEETFTPEPRRSREVFPVPRPLSPISNMFETIFKKFYSFSSSESSSKPKKHVRFDLSNIRKKSSTSKKGLSYYRSSAVNSSTSISPDTTSDAYPSTSFYAGPSIRSNETDSFCSTTPSLISSDSTSDDDFELSRNIVYPDSPNEYMDEPTENGFEDYDDTNDYLDDNFEDKFSADEYEQEMIVENEFEEGILPEENDIKIEEEVFEAQDHEMIVVENIVKQEDVIVDNEVEIELVVRDDSPQIHEDLFFENMEYEDEGICEDSPVFSDSNSPFLTDNAPASNERSVVLNLDLNKIFGEMDIEEIEKDALNTFSVLTDKISRRKFNTTNLYNKHIEGDGKARNDDKSADMRRSEHAQNKVVVGKSETVTANQNLPERIEAKTKFDIGCMVSLSDKNIDSTVFKSEYLNKQNIFYFEIKREYYSTIINVPAKKIKKEFSFFKMSGILGYIDAITTCVNYRDDSDLDDVQLDSDIEDETLAPYDANKVEALPIENIATTFDDKSKMSPTPFERPSFIPGKRPLTPTKTLRTMSGKLVTSVRGLLSKKHSIHACPEEGCNFVSLHVQKVVCHYVISHRNERNMYLFRCTECRQRFATREILQIHRKSHLSFNICHLCLTAFPSTPYLEEHAVLHRKMAHVTIKCNYCDLHFTSQIYLNRHLKSEQRLMKLGHPCYHKRCRFAIPILKPSKKKVSFSLNREVIENRTYLPEEKEVVPKVEPQDDF